MSENPTILNQSTALVLDPQTEKQLGQICLVGKPVTATEWISPSGSLQRFVILEGMSNLRRVWYHQNEVLLQTYSGKRFIKIITYPTEGENQGYLDYTSEIEKYEVAPSKSRFRISTRRGLAFIQSLLGT